MTIDGVLGRLLDLLTTYRTRKYNYCAIANLHSLQIITASTKLLPAYRVFISRSLATASNSGDSSSSCA
jgi:hypothetical protein